MKASVWLADSLGRVCPSTPPPPGGGPGLEIVAARGERISAQLAVRIAAQAPSAAAVRRAKGARPRREPAGVQAVRVFNRPDDGLSVRVRRVGYVPVPHHNLPVIAGHTEGELPGFVGDPLFDEDSATLWPGETIAFWLTVRVSPDARPGPRRVRLAVQVGDGIAARRDLVVRVADLCVQPRRDFPVTNWFYTDALLDRYGLRAFEPAFWTLVEKYVRNVVEHGQDTLYVPVFTPPLDGVKRPTQLLKVARTGRDAYRFDWSDVRRGVRLADRCGVRQFEWCHLFTQWGAAHAIRVYHGQGLDERLLWPATAAATGRTYRAFLTRFLPELRRFCEREGILDRSLFHLSDEPHGAEHRANYARARAMVRGIAPWLRTIDALSEIDFAREGLVDMPVPSISTVMQFMAEKRPCWTYFCCGPRGRFLQRLMDTPLAKIRMAGWLFYRTAVRGFLHWGYNYWYRRQSREMIDPFMVSDGLAGPGWAHGDPFLVYPGPDGPINSVRWEVFGDSLGDYALLQTLDVPRDANWLADLRAYDDFPVSADWIPTARHRLLVG